MAKKSIGIDCNSGYIRIVQMSRAGNRLHLEKAVSLPLRRQSDSPEKLIQKLLKDHKFDRQAHIAVSLLYNNIHFRLSGSDTDPSAPAHNSDDEFPISRRELVTSDIALAARPSPTTCRITAATDTDSLNNLKHWIENAGLICNKLSSPVNALLAAVKNCFPELYQSPSLLIYTDDSHALMVLTDQNGIRRIRNIPLPLKKDDTIDKDSGFDLLREIQLTWRAALNGKIPQDASILLAGTITRDKDFIAGIEHTLACKTRQIDFSRNIHLDKDMSLSPDFAVAQGLTIQLLVPETNTGGVFTPADKDNRNTQHAFRKQLIISVILVSLLPMIYLGNLFRRKTILENQYRQIQQNLAKTFHQALPDEPKMVDPVAQMQARLQALQAEFSGLRPMIKPSQNPLNLLDSIFAHTPPDLGITLTGITIDNNSIHLTGQCDTFEKIYEWKKILDSIPAFAAVAIENPDRSPETEKVTFSANITLKKMEPQP